MEREIKFRYKIKREDKIIYDTDREFGYMQFTREIIQYEDKQLYVEHEMQYTGFKLKNGDEVYEGDIVCYEGIEDAYKEYKEIVVSNGSWCVKWNEHYELLAEDVMEHDGDIFNMSVVGNIYENKELLKL